MRIVRTYKRVSRNTIQKHIISRFFKQYKKPFATAMEIYRYAQEIIPTITLATVYRNLRKLIKEREVLEIRLLNRKTIFALRGVIESGLLFSCKDCGEIQVFKDYELPNIAQIQNEKNLRIERASYLLYGFCQMCKNK